MARPLNAWMRRKAPGLFGSYDRLVSGFAAFTYRHPAGVSLSVFALVLIGLGSLGFSLLVGSSSKVPLEVRYSAENTITDDAASALALRSTQNALNETNTTPDTALGTTVPDTIDDETTLAMVDPVLEIEPAPVKPALAKPTRETKTVTLKSGDTLMNVLIKAGVARSDAYNAIQTMTPKFNPRKMRAGQEINLVMQIAVEENDLPLNEPSEEIEADPFTPYLLTMSLKTDVDRTLEISRGDKGKFAADEVITELTETFMRSKAVINSSLFLAAQDVGVPPGVIIELIRIYSYDVDFQREIRQGDSFEVFYSQFADPEGTVVKTGNVYFGAMTLRGKESGYYRFTTPDDQITDYYNNKGQSAKKFLMKTPVDGARISSSFGRRKHPVLGYTKLHKGVDFAAPRGTPIMAAGNGIIERANRFGSFGNYVRIRHANGYKTAYAHMKGFARGIRSGVRVKQGQIIGYVGTTGRSTGPHLHYEVHLNKKQVNPMTIRVPTGRKLGGKMLAAFRQELSATQTRMAEIPVTSLVTTAQLD